MTFADFYYAVRGILGHRGFVVKVEAENRSVTNDGFLLTWSIHVDGKVVGGFFYKPEAALAELRKRYPVPERIANVGDPNEIRG